MGVTPTSAASHQTEDMDANIIIIDDDIDFLDLMAETLRRAGFRAVQTQDDPRRAAALFEGETGFDIALIDMTMPEMDGLSLLAAAKAASPRTECIMVTAVNEARVAVDCLKGGAYDYLVKPVAEPDLLFCIRRALERKQLLDLLDVGRGETPPALTHESAFKEILTRSPNMMRLLKEAELHARSDVSILITGESGTGKELLARAVHLASPRASAPFTAVNMAALSPSLFEAELFGHTKGAFTGAVASRKGYLEHTAGGTLFLDEIGDIPLSLQGKLLRAIQEGEYFKLGESTRQQADVRFIAATNQRLEKRMDAGEFRKDLYYRIRGGWIHLPPLRERTDDIPLLAETFLREAGRVEGASALTEAALCRLMAHDYPGNIRELKSIIQSAANLAQSGPIRPAHLPTGLRPPPPPRPPCPEPDGGHDGAWLTLAEVEKAHVIKVYEGAGRNKSQAARLLGIGLNTLRRKLKEYGVV
jgi:DNA-binding NtrC family response regulator